MCTKLVCLISFICVLALASASYGTCYVLGNFGETGNGMDGWVNEWGLDITTSATGTTLGHGAIKVQTTQGWYQGAMDRVLTPDEIAMITGHNPNGSRIVDKFCLDVTRFATDWASVNADWGWWQPESRIFFSLSASAYNEDGVKGSYGAGAEVLGAEYYPSSISAIYGNDLHYPGNSIAGMTPDGTREAIWSLTVQQNALDALQAAGYIYTDATASVLGWAGMDIRLIANPTVWFGPDLGPVTYYLDNAGLCPEPATMALLGLGLALIRRKR